MYLLTTYSLNIASLLLHLLPLLMCMYAQVPYNSYIYNLNQNKSDIKKKKSCDIFLLLILLSPSYIMFFHHTPADCGGTLVLVSQDGIQRPPLHFPPGGHLLAFLSCLETGLLPRGQLEPPLWSQKGKVGHLVRALNVGIGIHKDFSMKAVPLLIETGPVSKSTLIFLDCSLLCIQFSFIIII